MLISAPGCSLSAGREVSLLALCAFRSLTCPAYPAGQGKLRQRYIARKKCDFHFRGVSHLALQSTSQRSLLNKKCSKATIFYEIEPNGKSKVNKKSLRRVLKLSLNRNFHKFTYVFESHFFIQFNSCVIEGIHI
jgi:hypothetical protein